MAGWPIAQANYMKFSNSYELRKYLAREVLSRELPRKPPAKERRGPERDAYYRAWIRTLPCCACGVTKNIEAAHTGSGGGMKQKPSDYQVVPLCQDCHTAGPRSYHGLNSSAADFEQRHCLNFPRLVARLNAEWNIMQRRTA